MTSGRSISDPTGRACLERLTTPANAWRWKYPRPPDVDTHPPEAAAVGQTFLGIHQAGAKERQMELRRTTGFSGGHAETGHRVTVALLGRGYTHSIAEYGGHLAAIGGPYNFQGNRRISYWMHRSDRTARRARAALERDGLLTSHLLLPGDRVDGMRAPVVRPHIVRCVAGLHRLARSLGPAAKAATNRFPRPGRTYQAPPRTSVPARSSAAARPVEPTTAEQFEDLAAKSPELRHHFLAMAAAARKRSVRPEKTDGSKPPEIEPNWDEETILGEAPEPTGLDRARRTDAIQGAEDESRYEEWIEQSTPAPPDYMCSDAELSKRGKEILRRELDQFRPPDPTEIDHWDRVNQWIEESIPAPPDYMEPDWIEESIHGPAPPDDRDVN